MESIGEEKMGQEFYKKIYSTKELYITLYKGLRIIKYMIENKKSKQLNPDFTEKVMLAITEVNGCEVCSYAHTKMALEQVIPISSFKECVE